jgi:hypothetical protein
MYYSREWNSKWLDNCLLLNTFEEIVTATHKFVYAVYWAVLIHVSLLSHIYNLTFSITLPLIGDNLAFLRAEIKSQKKQIKHLKKKSLWCRSLEEVTTDYFLMCSSHPAISSSPFVQFFIRLSLCVWPTCKLVILKIVNGINFYL